MEPLQTWWATELYPSKDEDTFGVAGDFEVVRAADAQATIAALQAQLEQAQEERSKYIQAVGLASTCAADMQIDISHPIEMMQEVCKQLTQRTAELEAVTRERDEAAKDRDDWITSWRALQRYNERIEAELERVRGELVEATHNANVYQSLYSTGCMDRALLENELRDAKAALTATSQEGQG